MKSSLSTLLFN
jgi:NAD(P)H-flavin reductase